MKSALRNPLFSDTGKAVMLLLSLSATSAQAAPSVFVPPAQSGMNDSWYQRKIVARVLGKSVGRTSLEHINAFLKEHVIYDTYSVCAVEPVEADTYVGLDKTAEHELLDQQLDATWSLSLTTPDGRDVRVQSVLFEACDGDDRKGAAVLIVDQTTGAVLSWQPMGWWDSENLRPIWAAFINPKPYDKDALFSYSQCLECSSSTNVYYDVRRKRFYQEYDGS